jgi:hypothetical protein
MGVERRQQILEAITAELRARGGKIDPPALATVIDAALDAAPAATGPSPEGAYAKADEGRTPDELNASNDE